ncbi:hypothetical protein EMIHUDRAFT_204642 [Emiliania huxleyi CCMP1516]|uniref:Uncharacterized protein n=2 Tax=Emiliania huxleyi TaxID=2903 RepID=A0A0D3JW25_EMIH1|nr:hypothetical protein EMIHUDRAFT_204642 [Emiliania huxleyi CCMP1516]EOD27710.1 hypothetical protein EMIHUDRAFT_204642 [Emiliania huxleyi CCMP1516]|eukprot:XP_005780139.1 hypothetical protein EMIHUDRAFT_204642 [Emiliania huxleyi CCMP1516]
MAAMAPAMNSIGGSRSLLPSAQQLHGPGRHLQILDHTVHRIDVHAKPNGEDDKEMVVSNLRHFTLKIGVIDPRCGIGRDAELPLKAELLYENGQLVEQLATCEPLLVGKTEVVAMQGTAMFKLRITSLSSHRDKQRFRIRGAQIEALQGAASSILLQLETLRELLQRAVGDAVAPPTPAKPAKPVPVVDPGSRSCVAARRVCAPVAVAMFITSVVSPSPDSSVTVSRLAGDVTVREDE